MGDVHGNNDEREKKVEVLEPGVTLVKPRRRYSTLWSILLRVVLASLFIGAAVFALVYSVNASNDNHAKKQNSSKPVTAESFNFYRTQSCMDGVLTEEVTTGRSSDGSPKIEVRKIGVSWIQDDATGKRIVHRVGLTDADWRHTYFVHENETILATKDNCTLVREFAGYYAFLDAFGLTKLQRAGSEQLKINDSLADVELYKGLPLLKENSVYGGNQPKLAQAFTQPDQGLVYGWQVWFNPTAPSDLHWLEYWFPDMEYYLPDAQVFFEMPKKCHNFV